jgi:agmatine/peptidylarginine deiminase
MWLRDFGPLVVRESGRSVAVDPEYLPGRPSDDQVPAELARLWRLPKDSAAIALEGGNLLTNGQGLLVATRSVQDMNAGVGRNEAYVRQVLAQHLGAREAVFLEPLAGEPTGHVDLFASFCSSETVIVGSYEKSEDAENAAILDRNAEVLRKTRTSRGVLRVVRIPMPSHGDGVWRTYTNVVYANGVVLVPSFAEKGRDVEARAMSAFAKELPGWRVVSIDAECLAELGGGLRCITMTLPSETDETKKPSP